MTEKAKPNWAKLAAAITVYLAVLVAFLFLWTSRRAKLEVFVLLVLTGLILLSRALRKLETPAGPK